MNILCVITARGGSKGVPGKNIAPVAGRPLIAWTIEAATKSGVASRTIVSTDNPRIEEISRECGAEVPFRRPPELAKDDTPSIPVLLHALRWMEGNGYSGCTHVLLLQPTSPLRTAEDIVGAVELLTQKQADSVIGVTEAVHHPYLVKRINSEGRLEDFIEKPAPYMPRQSFPPAYVINGSLYLVRREILLERETLYTDKTFPYVIPRERALDVDVPLDLKIADFLLKDREAHGKH